MNSDPASWLQLEALRAPELLVYALLVSAAALLLAAFTRMAGDRAGHRSWREVLVAARSVLGGGDSERVAVEVVKTARRLARADGVSLWWYDGSGEPRQGACIGRTLLSQDLPTALAASTLRKLARKPVPLAELGGAFLGVNGEVLALRREGRWFALLAVGWDKPPRDLARRRRQLTLFAPWAADALRQALEQDALQQALQRLRDSLEQLPTPLALWQASGQLVLANGAYRNLILQGPSPDQPPPALGETEFSLGDPPRIFVAATAPVADGRCIVSLYHEITREREALRAKDELLALVGHELRTPLTSIHGYSQMMARQLKVVQQQVGQLNQLIGDLMDASRLEGGQLALACQSVDVAQLARAAAERFRGGHEGRLLSLELEEVPPVKGDAGRLAQVLDNLLDNAAKYSPESEEIVLTVGCADTQVEFAVRDRGVGIAPEHLPHLFERFYRAPGIEGQHVKGLGLGLSIVRDLVAAHGGELWAESEGLGKGSAFRIRLPAASASPTSTTLLTIG